MKTPIIVYVILYSETNVNCDVVYFLENQLAN